MKSNCNVLYSWKYLFGTCFKYVRLVFLSTHTFFCGRYRKALLLHVRLCIFYYFTNTNFIQAINIVWRGSQCKSTWLRRINATGLLLLNLCNVNFYFCNPLHTRIWLHDTFFLFNHFLLCMFGDYVNMTTLKAVSNFWMCLCVCWNERNHRKYFK